MKSVRKSSNGHSNACRKGARCAFFIAYYFHGRLDCPMSVNNGYYRAHKVGVGHDWQEASLYLEG